MFDMGKRICKLRRDAHLFRKRRLAIRCVVSD